MTPEQVRYSAQVVLYTRFLAVRMMQAGGEREALAEVFLDLFNGRNFSPVHLSNGQDVEDFLVLVASGYDPRWAKWRQNREQWPDPMQTFDQYAALVDLCKTAWLGRIDAALRWGRRTEAELAGIRFLRLRERIRSFSRPLAVQWTHATLLVDTLCNFIDTLAQKSERNQRYEPPYIAPRRRLTSRPGFRGLGF